MISATIPQLFGASNHVATQVQPVRPWEYVPNVPPEASASKAAYVEWGSQPSTEHLFFTGTEGLAPNIRVSKQNPVYRLHAFIADFEPSRLTEGLLADVLKNCTADYKPNWLSRTFSGGVRMVWFFEEPIAMDHPKIAAEFMRVAFRELRVEDILPKIDKNAWGDLSKLYDVGHDWRQLSDKPIGKNTLHYWMTKAWLHTDRKSLEGVTIPIELVAEEVEKRFPGRWDGPFEIGRRGVVFFREDSKNPTAAQVTENGMLCFSTEKIFYTWAEIFGRSFVERFLADKIGAAIANVWNVAGRYFLKDAHGIWNSYTKEDFKEWLRVKHGIDAVKGRGEAASEMDRVLVRVMENRRLEGGIPAIYNPNDILVVNGRKMLNIAMVRVVQPVDSPQEWGVYFPWLAEFLTTCWDCPEQKDVFLAWLKRFYKGAFEGSLLKGQAMFIAGGVGRGKTLLGTQIIGQAMGGYADASDYLNSETAFNKELMEVALWTIDDGIAAQDPKAHQKFSEMVKRLTANVGFQYHPKYVDPVRIPWMGRIFVTLNDDASSIRILPNLDESIKDKVIILRFSDAPRQFPPWTELEATITRELPYFLRWLLDWTPPAEVLGDHRFGVRAYIHKGLEEQALYSGEFGDVLDIIRTWIKYCHPSEVHGETWRGSASDFIAELNKTDELRPLASKLTTRGLGRKFSDAAQLNDSYVHLATKTKYKGSGNSYEIDLRGLTGITPP